MSFRGHRIAARGWCFTLHENSLVALISDVPMDSAPGPGDTTVWTTDLTLPHARSEGRYRLVLEEFEVLPSGEPSHLITGEMHRLRLVHQDILPL